MAWNKALSVGAALLVAVPLRAQVSNPKQSDSQIGLWLDAEGLAADSAIVLDRAPFDSFRDGAQVVVVALQRFGPFVLLFVPSSPSEEAWKITDVPGYSDFPGPGIELVDGARVTVRSVHSYGRQVLTPYDVNPNSREVVAGTEYELPAPHSVLLRNDTLYAQYRIGAGGPSLLVRHPMEAIRSPVDPLRGSLPPPPPDSGDRPIPEIRLENDRAVIFVDADSLSIPLHLPDIRRFRAARPDRYPRTSVDVDVQLGPVVQVGREYWGGLTFYDGEGLSGVGGLVRLDPESGTGDVVYLPELVEWSVSALHWDGKRLVFARVVRPEGWEQGGGLGRYDPETGSLDLVDLPGVIGAITSRGSTMVVASTDGMFVVRETGLVQFKLSRRPSGWDFLRMVRDSK